MKDKMKCAWKSFDCIGQKTTKVFFLYTATGNRSWIWKIYEIIYDVWTFTKYSTTNQAWSVDRVVL
jgi:hypothetical protein